MSSSRLTRAGLATAAVASLTLAGLGAAAPALAAAPAAASLQLLVVNAGGAPLADVSVVAISETSDRFVAFGSTDDTGHLVITTGGYYGTDKLAAGTYALELGDESVARYKSDSLYTQLSKEPVRIRAGANDVGALTLKAGGVVTGTATTPSGHPLRGLDYDVESQSEDENGFFGFGFGDSTTFGNGSFEEQGLPVAEYDVTYDASDGTYDDFDDDEGDADYREATSFTVGAPGEHVTADFAVRVAATPAATTAYGVSPAPGQVRLVFKIANTRYGITDPHGVVTVTTPAGNAKGEPTPVTMVHANGKDTGRAIVSFPATAGTRRYVVHYGNTAGDADLLNTTRNVSVQVR